MVGVNDKIDNATGNIQQLSKMQMDLKDADDIAKEGPKVLQNINDIHEKQKKRVEEDSRTLWRDLTKISEQQVRIEIMKSGKDPDAPIKKPR